MDRHQIIFAWIRTQTLPIVIIFSLITLVGITNVMATVSLLVNERSKEIGILLSQGFQKYQIRNIFLIMFGNGLTEYTDIKFNASFFYPGNHKDNVGIHSHNNTLFLNGIVL